MNQQHLTEQHTTEVATGQRFEFGANWVKLLQVLDDTRIEQAKRSLQTMLEVESLEGKRFLDVGSGSGLFSLAARLMGAKVHSFDYDPQSVACTAELRRRYFADDGNWLVEQGSVLDQNYLARLGQFDVVYAWGVLHHTGEMWQAMENIVGLVKPGGILFVAIYNDQGRASRHWKWIKKTYNQLPSAFRWLILVPSIVRLWGPTVAADTMKGKPFATWRSYAQTGRGMSPWRDVVDWVGGWPFEVARPEAVFDFCRWQGFVLKRLKTCAGGHGCNEYVFEKLA